MTGSDNANVVSLPEALRRQFSGLEQRLWRTESLATVCLGASALLLSFLTLFVSDRLWETPMWMRWLVAGLGVAALVWATFGWLKQWVFRPRDQRALAVLVQQKHRRLGDRLLGIVELADEQQRPAHFSPALYRAAIDQVAAEASQFDFARAVDRKPAQKFGAMLAVCAAVALVPILLFPGAALNAFQRWIAPASPIERFTLVSLEGLPQEQIVAHGEAFDLPFQVRYRSIWKPKTAVAQIEYQPRLLASNTDGRARFHVPAQVRAGVLQVRLGDARGQVRIRPLYRPSLKELSANIELPAYLQYPSNQVNVETGGLDLLEGSRVAFRGKASHSLSAAQLEWNDQAPLDLKVKEDGFASDSLDLDAVAELAFSWRDQFGLDSASKWRLQVRPQKDSPPSPELPGLSKDTAMLQSEVLDLRATGRDDFGVRDIGVNWRLFTETDLTNTGSRQAFSFVAPTAHEKKVEEVFHFSPGLLMVPPDSIVEVRALATDFFPGRHASETSPYRIHVLGTESHAELIRQNLESLLSQLEEVTRLEEKLTASTRSLKELPSDKLKTSEATEQIAAAKEEQAQNASGLNQLAKEGKETLREAFRNPTFSEELLRDWTKTLQSMQQLSEESMAQASKALQTAQKDQDSRAENLDQALKKEEEILQALEEMQRKVNKGLDQLQALTLAQRLRKLATEEKDIAGRLHRIVPETIGLLPRELEQKFRDTETTLAGDQETAQKEAQVLHSEIGRFFERTQKASYGKVSKEMTDAHVIDALDHVRGLIQENISMDATHSLGEWAGRLNGWAELLEPKSDSSNGGGEGGGGASPGDEALMRELLGLLRVRDRENGLRQRTVLLDRQKPEARAYEEAAKSLASNQGQIREAMGKIQEDNPAPALEFTLQEIVDSMQGIQGLLDKPQTDRETELAQNKSIDLLSDVINLLNEQQQRSNSSNSRQQSASAEEMAFLMQMMAQQNRLTYSMGRNPKGGGSLAGGTTDRAATPMLGNADGKAAETREVRGARGTTENLPTEFREALENYFKAVEKLEQK
jgi:hypothetical protein